MTWSAGSRLVRKLEFSGDKPMPSNNRMPIYRTATDGSLGTFRESISQDLHKPLILEVRKSALDSFRCFFVSLQWLQISRQYSELKPSSVSFYTYSFPIEAEGSLSIDHVSHSTDFWRTPRQLPFHPYIDSI